MSLWNDFWQWKSAGTNILWKFSMKRRVKLSMASPGEYVCQTKLRDIACPKREIGAEWLSGYWRSRWKRSTSAAAKTVTIQLNSIGLDPEAAARCAHNKSRISIGKWPRTVRSLVWGRYHALFKCERVNDKKMAFRPCKQLVRKNGHLVPLVWESPLLCTVMGR